MTFSKSALTMSSIAMAMLFGGGVYLLTNINIIAKNYIERSASDTLGVRVTLGALDISLQERTAEVKNLTVGNPDGFKKPYAVKIETIDVALGSLVSGLVQFKDVDVGKADVNFEVRPDTTNIALIRKQLNAAPKGDATAEAIKVIISKLTLSQTQIHPSVVLFTDEEIAPVMLPDIVLTGIGEKQNGVLVQDAIAQVWAEFAKKIDNQAYKSGLLEGMSAEGLENIGVGFADRFKENLSETVNEKVEGLNQGLNKMFNE